MTTEQRGKTVRLIEQMQDDADRRHLEESARLRALLRMVDESCDLEAKQTIADHLGDEYAPSLQDESA